MPTKCVDVFDRSGAKLFSCSIALEEEGCLDAEFEEAALILAESCGVIGTGELEQLRACCDPGAAAEIAEVRVAAPSKRDKGAVVSLVKHRMKRAGTRAGQHRIRQVS